MLLTFVLISVSFESEIPQNRLEQTKVFRCFQLETKRRGKSSLGIQMSDLENKEIMLGKYSGNEGEIQQNSGDLNKDFQSIEPQQNKNINGHY